jgi:hypothetical protein
MVINAYRILTSASNGQSKKSVSVLDPVNNMEDLKLCTRVLTRLTSTSNLPIWLTTSRISKTKMVNWSNKEGLPKLWMLTYWQTQSKRMSVLKILMEKTVSRVQTIWLSNITLFKNLILHNYASSLCINKRSLLKSLTS